MSRQQLKRSGSFALCIILFLTFSVLLDFVGYLLPQSASDADITITDEAGVAGRNCVSWETVETNLLIEGRFPYAVWALPVFRLFLVLVFVAAATLTAIHVPAKRMRNMAITATINEL